MKTIKLIIGAISIALFIIIMLHSCAAGTVRALDDSGNIFSGSAGLIMAFAMLIAGIIGVAGRASKAGSIAAGVFYVIAALIGYLDPDMYIWTVLSLAFGIVFILGSIISPKPKTD